MPNVLAHYPTTTFMDENPTVPVFLQIYYQGSYVYFAVHPSPSGVRESFSPDDVIYSTAINFEKGVFPDQSTVPLARLRGDHVEGESWVLDYTADYRLEGMINVNPLCSVSDLGDAVHFDNTQTVIGDLRLEKWKQREGLTLQRSVQIPLAKSEWWKHCFTSAENIYESLGDADEVDNSTLLDIMYTFRVDRKISEEDNKLFTYTVSINDATINGYLKDDDNRKRAVVHFKENKSTVLFKFDVIRKPPSRVVVHTNPKPGYGNKIAGIRQYLLGMRNYNKAVNVNA